MGKFGLNQETFSAIFWGMLPAIAWMIFWIRNEEKENREPLWAVILVFVIGMLSVFIAIPLEKLVEPYFSQGVALTMVWAAIEEIIKYVLIILIIRSGNLAKDPIDWAIYFIVGALGFAGLENILFLMNPNIVSDVSLKLITGNLRYLGSTLLHAVSSGIIGIGLGLSYYQRWKDETMYLIGGLLAATLLHGMFNLFIINSSNQGFFRVFGFLWVVSIISILLLEKLRRLKGTM